MGLFKKKPKTVLQNAAQQLKNNFPSMPKTKVQGLIKNTTQSLQTIATKGANNILVLSPYRPLMIAMLKKEGITPEKDFTKLAVQFYNRFVKGRQRLNSIDPATLTLIITGIVTFFTAIKKRRDEQKAEQGKADEQTETVGKKVEEIQTTADILTQTGQGLMATGALMQERPTVGTVLNTLPPVLVWAAIAFIAYKLFKG